MRKFAVTMRLDVEVVVEARDEDDAEVKAIPFVVPDPTKCKRLRLQVAGVEEER